MLFMQDEKPHCSFWAQQPWQAQHVCHKTGSKAHAQRRRAAAHANSTGNLLCKAHSPRLFMLESEIWLSLQPLQKTAASPTSTEMRIFLTLSFYLPCLYMFTTRQLYLHSQYISTQPWSSSMTTGANASYPYLFTFICKYFLLSNL